MKTLFLAVKAEYFDQIKSGSKTEEYRLCTEFWRKRLVGREYAKVVITKGYPSKHDTRRRLEFAFLGFEVKTIQHEHFGESPVEVFAIKLAPMSSAKTFSAMFVYEYIIQKERLEFYNPVLRRSIFDALDKEPPDAPYTEDDWGEFALQAMLFMLTAHEHRHKFNGVNVLNALRNQENLKREVGKLFLADAIMYKSGKPITSYSH